MFRNWSWCNLQPTANKGAGRLAVVGSVEVFGDDWLGQEENAKLFDMLVSWLLGEGNVELLTDRNDTELGEYNRIPSVEAMAQSLKPCLQDMEELPTDFTKLFNDTMFQLDTNLIPEAVDLYKALGVKHEPLTLIPPQFECPLPRMSPAVWPPALREPPPPALDQFDLDEHFASEKQRLAQITNKCSGAADLEYYIQECGEILGVVSLLPEDMHKPQYILEYVFRQVVNYKKFNQDPPDLVFPQRGGGSTDPSAAQSQFASDPKVASASANAAAHSLSSSVGAGYRSGNEVAPAKGTGKSVPCMT